MPRWKVRPVRAGGWVGRSILTINRLTCIAGRGFAGQVLRSARRRRIPPRAPCSDRGMPCRSGAALPKLRLDRAGAPALASDSRARRSRSWLGAGHTPNLAGLFMRWATPDGERDEAQGDDPDAVDHGGGVQAK